MALLLFPAALVRRRGIIQRRVSEWNDDVVVVWGTPPRAYSATCPHAGGEIQCRRGVARCLWHDARFALEDGRCLNFPLPSLRPYRVAIEGDWIVGWPTWS